MLTVYLSHGLESGPNALKMQALKGIVEAHDDCEAVVMDYRDMPDPRMRLEHLYQTLEARGEPPECWVMAGSSLGGWLSAMVSSRFITRGCFMIAPALGLPDYPQTSPTLQARHAHILHGWQDDIVPPDPVIEIARRQRLSLRMINDDHRLHASMPTILNDFDAFLHQCLTDDTQ
ncbi:YqiA/YcfP family alpha/beta fold hydrolase [Vreelandella aquamarina]